MITLSTSNLADINQPFIEMTNEQTYYSLFRHLMTRQHEAIINDQPQQVILVEDVEQLVLILTRLLPVHLYREEKTRKKNEDSRKSKNNPR